MDLHQKLLDLFHSPKYQPLDKNQIARKLAISHEQKGHLRNLLRELEESGQIVLLKKGRYCVPSSADLVPGVILMNEKGFGYVVPDADPGGKLRSDIYIAPADTATAMHKDKVLVRINRSPAPRFHKGRMVKPREGEKQKPEGRVIKILERVRSQIVGTLQKSKSFLYVVPDDPRIPMDIYVPSAGGGKIGDKVVVKLEEWENRHINPEGEITEVLGPADDPRIDILAIIHKHDLPVEFPPAVTAEAASFDPVVPAQVSRQRRDLRRELIVTIDPDDAKDYDDAVQVERLPNGDWLLGVHIADVSHYVRPGSELDKEAQKRGNSVYLADRVIPMLPEVLSNGLCSLKQGVDRLVKSVFITFGKNGHVKKYEFDESVICSSRRLTYKQAFALLHGAKELPPNPFQYKMDQDMAEPLRPVGLEELRAKLKDMWSLASMLRKTRFAKGSLDLEFPEVKVWVNENGVPVKLEKVENDISHQLIEEFMLAANEVTALEFKNRNLPAVYRIHEKPDPDRLTEFREVIIASGHKIGDLTQKGEVQKFLSVIKGSPEEYGLKLGLLKSLKRACYATKPLGHYGLAKVNYTHFTSPIRRYADLIVHRVCESIIRGRPAPYTAAAIGPIAQHISATERVAADAENESVKLKKLQFFLMQAESKDKESFEAIITEIRNYGFFVELPEFILSGLVHLSDLDDDFYIFEESRNLLRGKATRKTFKVGQKNPRGGVAGGPFQATNRFQNRLR